MPTRQAIKNDQPNCFTIFLRKSRQYYESKCGFQYTEIEIEFQTLKYLYKSKMHLLQQETNLFLI